MVSNWICLDRLLIELQRLIYGFVLLYQERKRAW